MRPLLTEDGIVTEENIVTYPTTTEALGRGIDLIQHGIEQCCKLLLEQCWSFKIMSAIVNRTKAFFYI